MNIFNLILKIIGQILFVIIFFSTIHAKNIDKFYESDFISDYLTGVLLLDDNQYAESYKFFKKLDGLESSHRTYSVKYLYSLVNSGNLYEAFAYSKKLEKQQLDTFESDLIIGVYYLKNKDLNSANKYFLKAKKRNSSFVLNKYVSNSLYNWSMLEKIDLKNASTQIEKLDKRFENLKKIQNVFLKCFFNDPSTESLFGELTSNKKTDFSRYNYFYATHLTSSGKIDKAKKVVIDSLRQYPRNLLLNQYKLDLNDIKNTLIFECNDQAHVIAEILYITANALSSQSIYYLSNFYLNLAKYLNKDFHSFDTLLAENFYKTNNFSKAKKIYKKLSNKGDAYNWYSTKQLSKIFIKEKKKDEAINLVSNVYKKLSLKGIYETFDYAEILKDNEKFSESIEYYSNIINKIKKNHPLYPEARDGRGIAYERTGNWNKAESDFISSLEADPNQAYVINYLAYSWIEKGIKIEKSLNMLEKANKLRSNDPFIIDSLGWALFKLKKYKESKKYLQLAVRLMPSDPTVSDHYGDALWKNGNEIQARYYWNYVLNLEDSKKDLKKIIELKLVEGL